MATLALLDGKKMVSSTLSDNNGKFIFRISKGGNYTLAATFIGYKEYRSNIKVLTGRSSSIRVLMQPTTQQLGTIEITTRKKLFVSKSDKFIYNASQDIGNKSGSAADVLRKVPMLSVGNDGILKMRGSSNLKVLLNGVSSGIIAKDLKSALKMIPANSIVAIEVITAPSAKYEAEGGAGVINIITKKSLRGNSGSLDLNMGNLEQSGNIVLTSAKEKVDFNLNINGSMERQKTFSNLDRTSMNKEIAIGRLIQRDNDITKEAGVFADLSANYRPDSTQKLSVGISYWKGNFPTRSQLYNLYQEQTEKSEYNQISKTDNNSNYSELNLNYQKKFRRKGQELELVGMTSISKDYSNYVTDQFDLNNKYLSRETSPNKSNSRDYSFKADYSHPLSRSAKSIVETGISLTTSKSSSDFKVYSSGSQIGSEQLIEIPDRSNRMDYSQGIYAGYLSFRFGLGKGWVLKPGGRLEVTKVQGSFSKSIPAFNTNFNNFVTSVLLSKKINDLHDLRLNYTERIRRPWIWDLNPYVNASDPRNLTFGNPRLKPEVTKMLEAGHSYNASNGLSLNSAVYFAANSNGIESLTTVDSGGISSTTSMNIGSVRRIGTNVSLFSNLSAHWTLSGSMEYYHVWFKSKALSVRNSGNFFLVNLNSAFDLPKSYRIQISGDYSTGDIRLQGRTSFYYSYRISAQKQLWDEKASINLSLNNPFQRFVVQRSFASAANFNSAASNHYYNRSVSLSFSYKFGGVTSREPEENEKDEQQKFPFHTKKKR